MPSHAHVRGQEAVDVYEAAPTSGNGFAHPVEEPAEEPEFQTDPELYGQPYVDGAPPSAASSSILPQRNPGASGINRAPEPEIHEPRHAPTDTSAFFAARSQAAGNGAHAEHAVDPEPETEQVAPGPEPVDDSEESPIFESMVSEWLVDFDSLTKPPQDWNSVWDDGWSAAAQAEEAPVQSHTDHGLPVRDPGARLVPGSPEPSRSGNGAHSKPDDDEVASGRHESGHDPVPLRDPDAVRESISNHFGGVHAGRSHARHADDEMDTE
jgi:hypothetical protein